MNYFVNYSIVRRLEVKDKWKKFNKHLSIYGSNTSE